MHTSLPWDALQRTHEHTQKSILEVFPYLVDSLPHEVFLHGDVVANELLHGAAQQTVIEELVQVFLMLCGTQETPIRRNPGPGGSSTKSPRCLSHETQQTHTCQAQPQTNTSLNCGAEIAELDFAGDKSDIQSSTEYQNLEPVFSWLPPLGFVPAVTRCHFLSLGTLLCYTLQSFLMFVSLLEGTTSAENRFGKSRLHNPIS